MIDFKKEILKYRPVKTLEDLHLGIKTNEIYDINDYIRYIMFDRKGKRQEKHKQRDKDYGTGE